MLIIGHQSCAQATRFGRFPLHQQLLAKKLCSRNLQRLSCSDFHFFVLFKSSVFFPPVTTLHSKLHWRYTIHNLLIQYITCHIQILSNMVTWFLIAQIWLFVCSTVFDHSNMICQWSSSNVAGHWPCTKAGSQNQTWSRPICQPSSPPLCWLGIFFRFLIIPTFVFFTPPYWRVGHY